MIRVVVKLALLVWIVTASERDEASGNGRSNPPNVFNVIMTRMFSKSNQTELRLGPRQAGENRISGAPEMTLRNLRSKNESTQHLREDADVLLEKIKACRENHPSVSRKTFNFELFGSVLGELAGVRSEGSKDALRRCNISEELVDKLKAKLPQLENFQGIFVLIPKNNSSESPDHVKTTQPPTPLASNVHPRRTLPSTAVQNNLKLKLGDEWIPLQPKVSDVSHIYLGSSVYPILTEESRVLDKEQTISGRSTTRKSSFAQNTPVPLELIKGFVSVSPRRQKIYQLESSPEKKDSKTPIRFPRSLPEEKENREHAPTGEDAPHRLSLLPKNPNRWETSGTEKEKPKTKCPLNMNEFNQNLHYQMLYKLCTIVFHDFKQFMKIGDLEKGWNLF